MRVLVCETPKAKLRGVVFRKDKERKGKTRKDKERKGMERKKQKEKEKKNFVFLEESGSLVFNVCRTV